MTAYFEAGKGSIQRPEDHVKFSDNFERIFGKKDKKILTGEQTEDKIQPEVQDHPQQTKDQYANQEDYLSSVCFSCTKL